MDVGSGSTLRSGAMAWSGSGFRFGIFWGSKHFSYGSYRTEVGIAYSSGLIALQCISCDGRWYQEIRRQLRLLFRKADLNQDGDLTMEEFAGWPQCLVGVRSGI